jgi:hypothetical protein
LPSPFTFSWIISSVPAPMRPERTRNWRGTREYSRNRRSECGSARKRFAGRSSFGRSGTEFGRGESLRGSAKGAGPGIRIAHCALTNERSKNGNKSARNRTLRRLLWFFWCGNTGIPSRGWRTWPRVRSELLVAKDGFEARNGCSSVPCDLDRAS